MPASLVALRRPVSELWLGSAWLWGPRGAYRRSMSFESQRRFNLRNIIIYIRLYIIYRRRSRAYGVFRLNISCIYMIPVSGFVAPPPEWVGSTQEKGKKQYVSLCGSLTTRITCIHTYTQTIHTHIHTYRLIHTYTHTCMYIQTRPPHPQGGAGHTIDTHIHTYIQIHTYTHTCMYIQTRPPNPQGGGGGKTTCNRPAPPAHIDPCAPRPFGGGWGGACRPGPYIYIICLNDSMLILVLTCGSLWNAVRTMRRQMDRKRTVTKDPYNPEFKEVFQQLGDLSQFFRCLLKAFKAFKTSIFAPRFNEAYPNSEKIYQEVTYETTGETLRVPFRRIHLSDEDS